MSAVLALHEKSTIEVMRITSQFQIFNGNFAQVVGKLARRRGHFNSYWSMKASGAHWSPGTVVAFLEKIARKSPTQSGKQEQRRYALRTLALALVLSVC
jgi:hypothetical protein